MLEEKEIILRPNVTIPSYKPRQHNHNYPINVFQRVSSFTSPMSVSRKSLNKAKGNRAFDTVCRYSIVHLLGSCRGPKMLWEEIDVGKSFGLSCRTADCN